MTRIEIGKYLVADSRVCGGKLIFKGSRIKVADAIELAEAGYSPEEIAEQYHNLITTEAVIEALTLVRQGFLKEMSAVKRRAA